MIHWLLPIRPYEQKTVFSSSQLSQLKKKENSSVLPKLVTSPSTFFAYISIGAFVILITPFCFRGAVVYMTTKLSFNKPRCLKYIENLTNSYHRFIKKSVNVLWYIIVKNTIMSIIPFLFLYFCLFQCFDSYECNTTTTEWYSQSYMNKN